MLLTPIHNCCISVPKVLMVIHLVTSRNQHLQAHESDRILGLDSCRLLVTTQNLALGLSDGVLGSIPLDPKLRGHASENLES